MSEWLRVGGRGRLPDGGIVIWSLAEGARGRRWRWVIDDVGIVRHAGLVELDDAGRVARLEVSSSAGLLTVHREADGSLHGNVVDDGGVRPIALVTPADHAIAIDDDAFGSALVGRPDDEVVRVTGSFDVAITRDSGQPRLDVDVRGVPSLAEATEWPLEADDPA